MKKYKVLINYPSTHFNIGDILISSDKIPNNCFGKFIDNTTGWAWVANPEKYPECFIEV